MERGYRSEKHPDCMFCSQMDWIKEHMGDPLLGNYDCTFQAAMCTVTYKGRRRLSSLHFSPTALMYCPECGRKITSKEKKFKIYSPEGRD